MKPNLESLTEEQRERLRKLEAELRFDKITVSFMIEDRDGAGRRKQTFYSATVTRWGEHADDRAQGAGWTQQEARVASCLLSRQVIETAYGDALRRKILPREVIATELPGILAAYDEKLVKLMSNGDDELGK